jgi:hypothetical protein
VLAGRVYLASDSTPVISVLQDCSTVAPAAPTPTRAPTPYPTYPPEPSFTPTSTPTPRPVTQKVPQPSPTAPWLQARINRDAGLVGALGCPNTQSAGVQMAIQVFQKGSMLWRADARRIYVLSAEGTWSGFEDTWDSTQPEGGTESPPAPDLISPKRGFGKVWRDQLGGVRSAIGWATGQENSVAGQVQQFQRGLALANTPGDYVRILFMDGTWR